MKKWIVPLLLLFTIGAKAQTDSLEIKTVEPPDSTEIGVPDGKAVSKEIGPTGGRIVSEDARVELIFPSGALTAATPISIQPTTNPAPNGTGKAYQFEPSGIQFKKPVQIIFHYTDREAAECPADLMGFALQDGKGKWSFIDFDGWDSVTKTLQGSIEHFSGASIVKMLELRPEKKLVATGEVVQIRLIELTPRFKKKSTWGRLEMTQLLANYKVNNIVDGNDEVGKMFIDNNYMHKGKTETYTPLPIYIAPRQLPPDNPVTITTELGTVNALDKMKVQRTLSCQVEVYDEYQILVRDTMSVWEGRGQYVADSGSFVIRVTHNNVLIKDIVNNKPYSYRTPVSPFPCKMDLVLAGCEGTVDVGTIYSAQQDKEKPRNIFVRFNTSKPVLAFRFMERCPGAKTSLEDMPVEPVPNIFHFKADGTYQRIRVDSRRITSYSIYITPVRAENKYGL
jgi:hypothetical protein